MACGLCLPVGKEQGCPEGQSGLHVSLGSPRFVLEVLPRLGMLKLGDTIGHLGWCVFESLD